jgi:hypothetical protein
LERQKKGEEIMSGTVNDLFPLNFASAHIGNGDII